MLIKRFLPALALALAALLPSAARAEETFGTGGGPVTFAFKYATGDSYRILSTVDEDVYVNLRLHHKAEIINRISTRITGVNADGSATHESTFMTTEHALSTTSAAAFSWGEEYRSVFDRSPLGVYTIGDQYFMPTVRDVPVFPARPVKPGDTWTAEGHEAHDLRQTFGLQAPYKVPFTATYTYLGTADRKKEQPGAGAPLHVFRVKYSLYMEAPARGSSPAPAEDYPQTMMGFSDELVYWDAEKGAIDHYTETFRIMIETAYGTMYEFRGTARAEVTDFIRTSTPENVAAVQKQVRDMGLQNVTVRQSERGLTLAIEDIKFKAESSVLLESEKGKLEQIARILSLYPGNDILISGHTAAADNGRDPQALSEERAQTVADYLLRLGVRGRAQLFTQGFGDTRPVAPNTTEAGKARNRRVEITILDN